MEMKLRNVELAAALLGACVIIAACGTSEQRVVFDSEPPPGPPPLTAPDASAQDANSPEHPTMAMCASAKCQAPFETCSHSKFLCDVDLSTDSLNCGSCGNECPTDGWRSSQLNAAWKCIDGGCRMTCANTLFADCNGRIEDGCETSLSSVQNCGACGVVCPAGSRCANGICTTCKPDEVLCGTLCVNLKSDFGNCGACGNRCTMFPAGFPPPKANMNYGCEEGTCNHLQCSPAWLNCNGDLEDGCEVNYTTDPNNCGGCGKKCAAGQACISGNCQCDPGPSGCDCLPDFESNVMHCGSCGLKCSEPPNSTTKCEAGRCVFTCKAGMADCNLNDADGCETNIYRDPQNCGSCGAACETGQACIDGACATEPCPDGVVQ